VFHWAHRPFCPLPSGKHIASALGQRKKIRITLWVLFFEQSRMAEAGGLTEALIKARSGEFDLASIQRLSLENGSILRIENLQGLINLRELCLSGNKISVLSGLEALTNLRKLDISSNQLTKVDGLGTLTQLESLMCQDNRVARVADLAPLAAIQSVRIFYLQESNGSRSNPVCKTAMYFEDISKMLSQLQVLDGEQMALKAVSVG
jgi:Leucine-rich repeat (LRR) protein